MIFHIADPDTWMQAQRKGVYAPPSLEAEGFIHCSTGGQVVHTANRIFRGRENLVLLCIDPDLVPHRIVYENLEGGKELFPHIYGPLDSTAVKLVVSFPCGEEGNFIFPGEIPAAWKK